MVVVCVTVLFRCRFADLDKWCAINLFTLCERLDSPICYTTQDQLAHSSQLISAVICEPCMSDVQSLSGAWFINNFIFIVFLSQ